MKGAKNKRTDNGSALNDKMTDVEQRLADAVLAYRLKVCGVTPDIKESDIIRLQNNKLLPEGPKPGVLPERFNNHGIVGDGFNFGILAEKQGDKIVVQPITDVRAGWKAGMDTPEVIAARVAAMQQAGSSITALGLPQRITNGIRDVTKQRYQEVVREAVANGFGRKTRDQIASNVARATGDIKRDLQRVALTETNNAKLEGQARVLEAQFDDPLVFKRPAPDACEDCKRLYAPGGIPRVFRLSELRANGMNGKRGGRPNRADWLPTLGGLHPNCVCVLSRLPRGFTLDRKGRMVPIKKVKKSEESFSLFFAVEKLEKTWHVRGPYYHHPIDQQVVMVDCPTTWKIEDVVHLDANRRDVLGCALAKCLGTSTFLWHAEVQDVAQPVGRADDQGRDERTEEAGRHLAGEGASSDQ